jgi:hypothetical protein
LHDQQHLGQPTPVERLGEQRQLGSRAQTLIARNDALGLSALESMPSVAGRTPPNLWPGSPTDDEVGRFQDGHVERFRQHVIAARTAQVDASSPELLAGIERYLTAHQQWLGPT